MTGTDNQGFPVWGKIIQPDGSPSQVFFRWMVSIWKKTGSSFQPTANAVYLQDVGGTIELFDVNGNFLGIVQTSDTPGGPAVPQVVGASPFVFASPSAGALVVESGEVELSRDGGATWYQVSLTGGACPVVKNDQVRVTWFSATIPKITFFPAGS